MQFSLTLNGVTVTVQEADVAGKDAHGIPKGKPTPEQWAAFIAALLQALLALFIPPAPAGAGAKPPGK